MNNYKPVIGLEIHVELSTRSKMFCGCPADWFGKEANSQVCPTCLGLPGAMPVPNKVAIEWTMKLAAALGCTINSQSKFDRKHYFYPDLPKGYQISQYDQPFGINGHFTIINQRLSGDRPIRIRRVHLEEDTGKLTHEGGKTSIDFNRSGVPLVEIVTEPDFVDSEKVKIFLEELQILVRLLGISDANMEQGSMRLEPNISLQTVEETRGETRDELPNYKVEVKNINSFRFAKSAIDYELIRQMEILEKGEIPKQETRGWSEAKGKTISQRSKEEAHDYRYFPEPDIPPFEFDEAYITAVTSDCKNFLLYQYDELIKNGVSPADTYTLLKNETKLNLVKSLIKSKKILALSLDKPMSRLASIIINNRINLNNTPLEIEKSIIAMLLPKNTDLKAVDLAIDKVLHENNEAVTQFKKGKTNAIMFLVGQVMRDLKGDADAKVIREKLDRRLK